MALVANRQYRSPSCIISDSQKLQNLKEIYKFGEKGSGRAVRGIVQDFIQLRHQNLKSGTLFTDPQFPADNSSLYYSAKHQKKYKDIIWKRPYEICRDPKLFVDSFSRFDVQQGRGKNCWLLSAIANLTLHDNLFLRNVPKDQSFDKDYAGIFHFRFWQYGRWIDVVIDDRLPTADGELAFLHSKERNEFWSSLFEKAYAKLNGCYEALNGGTTIESMTDFTGGVTEVFKTADVPPNFFKLLKNAYDRGCLIALGSGGDGQELLTPEGLVTGHSYSCTKVVYLNINKADGPTKIALLRLRNPWGDETEWKGAWSDKSSEWRLISEDEKRRIGLTFDKDGEFWMSFQDVLKYFMLVEICNLTPDSLEERDVPKKWELSMYEGAWVKGVTAGGCRNYLETFGSNPQYNIKLSDADEDGECSVIISLIQKNRRILKNAQEEFLTIGFVLYYISDPNLAPKPLDKKFFKRNKIAAKSRSVNVREVCGRFDLSPGTYCIIPSTFDPHQTGDFLLRVFSETRNNLEEYDQPVGAILRDKEEKRTDISTDTPIYKLFHKYAGEQEQLSWMGLQNILNSEVKNETKNFSTDVCKSLVALLDENNSGKLGFDEFIKLWEDVNHWTQAFQIFDTDKSHTLNGYELREAINTAGFTVNARTLNMIMHRYGNKNVCLNFDDFILCVIKLKHMIEKFKRKDSTGSNEAAFSMEEFIDITMYS